MPKGDKKKTASALSNWRLLAIAPVLVVIVLFAALSNHHPKQVTVPKCGVYRNDKTVRIGSTNITAEIAKTPAEQTKGLSGRPCIEQNQAMLFVFNHPGHYAFWMKDMHFPIDIVWISADKRVAGLEQNVLPSTYPDRFINKDNLAQYVLEIQANRSKSLNIDLGTPVSF